jgi:hypothetical protein
MAYEFNFVTDAVLRNKAYPALAEWQAVPYTSEWREFRYHWPYTVPCELHEHCATHDFAFQLRTVKNCQGSQNFYTIGLGFFDFAIDYFDLIPQEVFDQQLTVLFYYHEGDNPYRIKQRLDQLCAKHCINPEVYKFVSGNTASNNIKNFAWFLDHELLYWHRNKKIPPNSIHLNPRPYRFTILNRTHKWWRATVMADLQRSGILDVSQWSYNTAITIDDNPADNPIEIDTLLLSDCVTEFLQQGPYSCDKLSADQHNDHHLHVHQHFSQSYCHVVLETHFDADQSDGAFLTEKTFKPIKHGQPFVIVGAPGSLQALRDLGYRTFDHAIDNSYDLETNNTLRFRKTIKAIEQILSQNLHEWYIKCREDIEHNQKLFVANKHARLLALQQKLEQN